MSRLPSLPQMRPPAGALSSATECRENVDRNRRRGIDLRAVATSAAPTVLRPKAPGKKKPAVRPVSKGGAPGEIRTPDPQVRSLVLYPTELRAHMKRLYRGGAREDRTPDLVIANDALSQLSYGPTRPRIIRVGRNRCQHPKQRKNWRRLRGERWAALANHWFAAHPSALAPGARAGNREVDACESGGD